MSNAGQAALIIVGTVVGAYFGAPQLGFVLGSLAGSVLFPTQLPRGPQMTDNRTTSATIGGPVPIVFGTADVAGTVIWLAPYVQTTNHSSAKGGPQQTTYQYNQSIAISLCEAIPGGTILRIWENGTIVYDIRPQQLANADLNLLAETDVEYANRLLVSGTYAETFVFYDGAETQLPDPTIESVLGMGNVPAFRGLCYLVYPNRLLQTQQAWRHPTFRFEVAANGAGECTSTPLISNDFLAPWDVGNMDPRIPGGSYLYSYVDSGTSTPRNNIGDAFADAVTAGNELQPHLYGNAASSDPGGNLGPSPHGGWSFDPLASKWYLFFNHETPTSIHYDGVGADPCTFVPSQPDGMWWLEVDATRGYGHGVWHWPFPLDHGTHNCGDIAGYGAGSLILKLDTSIEVYRYPAAPPDPCLGLPDAPNPIYCVRSDGRWIKKGGWVKDVSGAHTYLCLQASVQSSLQWTKYPLNPTIRSTDASNTSAFWTAAYDAAVLAGDMVAGLTYGVDYPVQVNSSANYAWLIDETTCEGNGGGVTLASIITAVCARAGLLTVDAADMADVSIWGYSVSAITSAAAILTPLRSVGFFDVVESQGLMHFPARGKPVVATLTTDDIGAYEETGNTVPPPSVTAVRAQDEDLPRTIRLKYKGISRDYQDNEQDSPFRETKAVNDVDVALPLCLGDVQAVQCAEVLWADSWAARTSYQIAVDQSWLGLDVGDCIAVPVDGVMTRMRIVSDTISSGVLRKLSCLRDDGGAYISFAVPSVPQVQPQRLTFIGPASFELLDLPALSDGDNDAGFYVAVQRQAGGGVWNGALIYQSVDGVTYAQILAATIESVMGTINAPVPASEPYTWDMSTTIVVNVANASLTFESRTDAAVLAGANAAAMGADGRWEVLQFATATQVSPTQWHLSRLLRGRRGTEHVMGSSVTGDSFVMLSTGDLERVVLESSQLGATLHYKVVALGASYASGINQSFAGHGQALVPFSPVSLAAAIVDSPGDIHITWFRRGRLGRTLMSGVDIPLSEATEAYQVDIYGGSPLAVVRTLTVTTQLAIYTAAEQVTDFGGPVTGHIKVAVYQISATVGRGTPAIATLTL